MSTLRDTGALLVAARRAAHLTQRQLGERLGVAQQQIARWERDGYASAAFDRVCAVADELGVTGPDAATLLAAEQGVAYAAGPALDPLRRLASLGVSPANLAAFCRLHGIERLELFGSVLRRDFGPGSDIDMLVTYLPGRSPSLMEAADLELALEAIVRRRVDLVTRASVERSENVVRKSEILESARTVYEA